jgi:hypothetical protein
LNDAEEKTLLAALIGISSGVKDAKLLNLPEEVGTKLLQCYEELAKDE